ncbi:bifunctional folylpolyglutamate synthase/dihydrofolate synthase [Granulosicoccus antarcticus]|uniref:Dihydrofolate synthase/folylpolyglutamate synthase n=1 Tax=Granulosicoccus antarcticus IMCC3135 TaxID=1192854 RepID=A0A2Z2P208_9GAMM|nr:folylpolyglutamate synthase/dihydrofolate synthase family protein [Granulosicoccus antarcticus]ASJ75330.1 Bifunctional protein FolC [Granulosicoccus antarcticus IMCC3135]
MTRTLPLPAEVPDTTAPLSTWLSWLETIHPVAIDMGLDRVSLVAERLGLRQIDSPLILVGGTNGKGSTVAMLTAIYTAAGYRVGTYTSPHITDFRERIRINAEMASAEAIVEALAFVEAGRAPQTLTYFEYTTLAAMRVFLQAQCDVYIMEVGLGGRLDATNLWDADCSVVTSVALDHQDYLGSDIAVIATEKAAIGRPGKLLVVGELTPPESLFAFAAENGIPVLHTGAQSADRLPLTSLRGAHQRRNAACAVAVVENLQAMLPVGKPTLERELMHIHVTARFERLTHSGLDVVLDVAHNPAGAQALCQAWQEAFGDRLANIVFSALADKDLAGIVAALEPIAAEWHCFELHIPRATPVATLTAQVQKNSGKPVSLHASAEQAWHAAFSAAEAESQAVLVAGSFHTIADIHEVIATHSIVSS